MANIIVVGVVDVVVVVVVVIGGKRKTVAHAHPAVGGTVVATRM